MGGIQAERAAHPDIGGQQSDHMIREVALSTVGKPGGERGG